MSNMVIIIYRAVHYINSKEAITDTFLVNYMGHELITFKLYAVITVSLLRKHLSKEIMFIMIVLCHFSAIYNSTPCKICSTSAVSGLV